jgi:hypothetical protein
MSTFSLKLMALGPSPIPANHFAFHPNIYARFTVFTLVENDLRMERLIRRICHDLTSLSNFTMPLAMRPSIVLVIKTGGQESQLSLSWTLLKARSLVTAPFIEVRPNAINLSLN